MMQELTHPEVESIQHADAIEISFAELEESAGAPTREAVDMLFAVDELDDLLREFERV